MIRCACTGGFLSQALPVAGQADHSTFHGIVRVFALGIDAADGTIIGHDPHIGSVFVGDVAAVDSGGRGGNQFSVLDMDGWGHDGAGTHGGRPTLLIFDAIFFKPIPGFDGNIGNSGNDGNFLTGQLRHKKDLLSKAK